MQELVVESLVVSLAMVVVDVLAHEETQVPFAEGDDATETLPCIERTNRSAYALRLGLFGGRRIGWTPPPSRISPKPRVESGSRS